VPGSIYLYIYNIINHLGQYMQNAL